MMRMYMNVARPIVVGGKFTQSFRAQSFARRSVSTDPYISNREERRGQGEGDKSAQKVGEDWKGGKSGEEGKHDKSGEDWKNSEGIQASNERARDRADKDRLEGEKGGLNSYAAREQAREQAAREQARSTQDDKSKDSRWNEDCGMSNEKAKDSGSSFGMSSGRSGDTPMATKDRAKDELNASSGFSSDKSRNFATSADRGQTATQNAKNSATEVFQTAKDKAASAAQSAKDTAASAAQSAKDTAASIAQTIKDKAGDAKDKAAELGRQASGKIQEKSGDAKEYFDKKKDEKR